MYSRDNSNLLPRWIPDLLLGRIPDLLPALLPRDLLLPVAWIVVLMVLVYVMLVYVVLADAHIET